MTIALVAILSLASTALSVWLVWRRALERHPQEYAFRALARHLKIPRAQREAIRAVAASAGAAPVGLLLSPEALRQATETWLAGHEADPRSSAVREVAHRLAA